LVATSPNSHVTNVTYPVTLGTVPTVLSVQPPDGTKLYASAATTIQITAIDKESDPMQYQVLLDGTPLGSWSAATSQQWTPGVNQLGLHTLTASVRDDYGSSNGKNVEVFVVRPPIQHP